jgi:hypothetical protein
MLGEALRAGLTVVEAVIALVLVALVTAAVYRSMAVGSSVGTVTGQRIAAFGLCADQFERMRGGDYRAVTVSNHPPEAVRITHLRGGEGSPILGVRSNTIINLLEPARKQVTVTVTWDYRGRAYEESLTGAIFQGETHASTSGGKVVGGRIGIDPNGSADRRFVLTLPNGNTVTDAQLRRDYAGYAGPATCVFGKPNGEGSQECLLVNGRATPLRNADAYQISSPLMSVRLYNDRIGEDGKAIGKWWISITAVGAEVVTH